MPVTNQRYEPDAELIWLIDHPQNPRRGADPSVATSVDRNGWYGAIIVQQSTGHILAGHTRRRVLLAANHLHGPVMWVDCDDETALRILLADNRTAELAAWDDAELLAVLREIGADDLDAVGFDADDMATLQRKLDAISVGTIVGSERDDDDGDAVSANAVWAQAGMPEYASGNVMPAFSTTVHFLTHDDADAFFRSIDREKARSWWWPQPDGFIGALGDMQAAGTPSTS
jgi:hypothetical protein